ncbi:MAG: hypothetical protein AAGC74_14755, partial [Verrucomicrobiota bacterium]
MLHPRLLSILLLTLTPLHSQEGETTLTLNQTFATSRTLPTQTEASNGENPADFLGLFDYLGRSGQTTASFLNPALLGRILATSTTPDPTSSPLHKILSADPSNRFLTTSEDPQLILCLTN